MALLGDRNSDLPRWLSHLATRGGARPRQAVRQAVMHGIRSTAGVVTSAAVIMVAAMVAVGVGVAVLSDDRRARKSRLVGPLL